MNVAEIDLLAPPARPATSPGPEAAAAEPFDRVLARHAADDPRPRAAEGADRRESAATGDTAAETAEVRATDDSDSAAAGDRTAEDTDSEAAIDADDGGPAAITIGPGAARAEAPAAAGEGGGCAPDAKAAATPKAAGATPGDAQAQATVPTASGATASAKADATEPAAPAAPSTPASDTADADATAKATPVPPDASEVVDADGTDEDAAGTRRTATRAHAAETKAAPAAPAPDKPVDTGLARAMQQAAAPAQAALARAAEAAATRHAGEGEAHGAGPDRADALGSTSATSDASQRVTGDVRTVRAEAARHAPAFDRVMDQTLRMVRLGHHEANVRLVPDHLGEVHVRVSMDRGHVVADLTAHNPVTRELLESHQARLQQALLDGGADGARVNVSLGGEPGHEARDEGPAPWETAFPEPATAEAPKAAARAAAPGPGGLSIRA